ncbi:MAG: DUF997 family protein [Planctomycetaceae bacterium]
MPLETTPTEALGVPVMGDPESRHLAQCLREVRIVVLLWLAGLAWTLVVVVGWGYVPVAERPEVPALILGIPSWVVWGLVVPWCLEVVAAWWFAVRVLADDDFDPDSPVDSAPAVELGSVNREVSG